jgi:hypothetical protein
MNFIKPDPQFNNPNRIHLSASTELFLSKILSQFVRSKRMIRFFSVLGSFFELVDFINNNKKISGSNLKVYESREKLYGLMMEKLFEGRVLCCEFGVAWGYTSAFWLVNVSKKNLKWIGFDRFEGLPRSWDDHPKGAFSTGGSTPPLNDERVSWVVGDIEATLSEDIVKTMETFDQRIFFFDFDIFEPSLFAYQRMVSTLKSGDLLYFDEARMIDERFLIKNYVSSEINFRLVGLTVNAIAIEVI